MSFPSLPDPPQVTEPRIGRLVGPSDVRAAVVTVLQTWLPAYLGVVERDRGWSDGTIPRPPSPASYRTGVDFLAWAEDTSPTVITTVTPREAPVRTASAGYQQDFDAEVGATVLVETDVDSALELAGLYGTAIQGVLLQQGDLGGLGAVTHLRTSPADGWDDPDVRDRVLSVTHFGVCVESTVNDEAGLNLPAPPEAPYGPYPIVTSENLDVEVLQTDEWIVTLTAQEQVLTDVLPPPQGIVPGQTVTGPGIPPNTYVLTSNTQAAQIYISQPAEVSVSGVAITID